MKFTRRSVALAMALATLRVVAQSTCEEVTEYVTVTADIEEPGYTETPSSYCEEVTEYVTITADANVPETTEALPTSPGSVCEEPSTTYVTEYYDPITITLSPSAGVPESSDVEEPTTTIRLTSTIEALVTVYPSDASAPAIQTNDALVSYADDTTDELAYPTQGVTDSLGSPDSSEPDSPETSDGSGAELNEGESGETGETSPSNYSESTENAATDSTVSDGSNDYESGDTYQEDTTETLLPAESSDEGSEAGTQDGVTESLSSNTEASLEDSTDSLAIGSVDGVDAQENAPAELPVSNEEDSINTAATTNAGIPAAPEQPPSSDGTETSSEAPASNEEKPAPAPAPTNVAEAEVSSPTEPAQPSEVKGDEAPAGVPQEAFESADASVVSKPEIPQEKPAEQPTEEVDPAPADESNAQSAPVDEAVEEEANMDETKVDSAAADTSLSSETAFHGKATFYGGNLEGGHCSFANYTIPSGIFGTALSGADWDNAGACGACMEVTNEDGDKIKAMVVDECPDCETNSLDLFSTGFAKLADPSLSHIPIDWHFVPCSITSPLLLKNKSGTSAYYFSMQVVNSNTQVAKLEVSTDGSNWLETTRQPYNYFLIEKGTGSESVTVRVTDVQGKVITVENVSVADGATKSASANF